MLGIARKSVAGQCSVVCGRLGGALIGNDEFGTDRRGRHGQVRCGRAMRS